MEPLFQVKRMSRHFPKSKKKPRGVLRDALRILAELPDEVPRGYDEAWITPIHLLGKRLYPKNPVAQTYFSLYALGVRGSDLLYAARLLDTYLYFRLSRPQGKVFNRLYKSFDIPKRSGGVRTIDAPIGPLRKIQKLLVKSLSRGLDGLLGAVEQSDCVHGFRSGRSTITNALPHVGQPVVVKMDIKDFFSSISIQAINRALGAGLHQCGLVEDMPWVLRFFLLEILTCRGRLPTGAPTSPVLSNLVLLDFDYRIARSATQMGGAYTRYGDDLTLSGPEAVVKLIGVVKQRLDQRGLRMNEEKTCLMRRGRRQKVCGLVVNTKVNVPRDYRRKVRAMAHRIQTGRQPTLNGMQLSGAQARGHIAYAAAPAKLCKP